jgi:hypothetical protein
VTALLLGALLLASGPGPPDALSRESLRNTDYPSAWAPSGRVRLHDGRHREPAAPGSASEIRVWLLDQLARWRVSGRRYAAVVLATDPGGSGTFYELVAVEDRGGRPVAVARAELGDRVRVQSLSVAQGTGPPIIRVDLVVPGPDEPLCCPTQLAVRRFAWRAGALVPVR